MEWTRSETIGLANHACSTCHGLGVRPGPREAEDDACHCVYKRIFRLCMNRFKISVEREKHLSHCTLHYTGGKSNSFMWGRKEEEYIADFLMCIRRELSAEESKLFRFRYLLGADHRLCAIKLRMDRGDLFHTLYRIEVRLGKAFVEMHPYALYPLDDYFFGVPKASEPCKPPASVFQSLRPPLSLDHRTGMEAFEELDPRTGELLAA